MDMGRDGGRNQVEGIVQLNFGGRKVIVRLMREGVVFGWSLSVQRSMEGDGWGRGSD